MLALSRALILVVLTATIFSTVAVAAEFIVGDDKGWTTNVDYQAWAANKIFRVGDILVFNYPPRMDNVVIVNSTEFIKCTVAPNAPALNSGHDAIMFGATGPRFYISGVGDHCKLGQRLALFVLPHEDVRPPVPSSLPPAAPAPWSDAPESPPVPPFIPAPVPFVPVPTAPAPWSHSPPAPPVAPFVPGPAAPAPWTDAPAPSPESPSASWTTSFSHFARSVPRKLFKVFQ